MARLTLDDALRALAVTLLFAGACESRAPIGPIQQPQEPPPVDPPPVDPPPVDPPPVVVTRCDSCHGAPPQTGAHLAHALPVTLEGLTYGDLRILQDVADGGTRYMFGCGHCHPIDPAAHEADLGADGLPDVVLTPPDPAVSGDAIKFRNTPQAGWNETTGTCSGVYCHSSGHGSLDAPLDYRATPAWTATTGALGCDECHGNPPRYPSAGAGSAAPNSHIELASDGWEWGHYAGMPGPWHWGGSKHGGGLGWTGTHAASPVTCQSCHYDTVDPANVKPGGFFYLDTEGSYVLDGPAANSSRLDDPSWLASQCGTCHDGVIAPKGAGRVLPLRHVNGRADVVFDPRPSLPVGYATGLPALATPEPLAPYFVWSFNASVGGWTLPPGTAVRKAGDGSDVLALSLEHAAYDPATRTCTNVGCHLARQSAVDSGAGQPLRWGERYACGPCHDMY